MTNDFVNKGSKLQDYSTCNKLARSNLFHKRASLIFTS
jgi:hypothetical protein